MKLVLSEACPEHGRMDPKQILKIVHHQSKIWGENIKNHLIIFNLSALIHVIRGWRYSTIVESSLQIDLFMQNKPNFRKSQMNVNTDNTRDYENKSNWTLGQNKPNSNPIKANFRKAQMNVNLTLTKDYRKNDDFSVRKNKPNFQNAKNERKRICYRGL